MNVPVRVKICGLTNLADAEAAVSLGADAVGFIFHRSSPRYVAPAVAREISESLPPFVARVGVFVNSALQEVRDTLARCRLDLAQLHGEEDEDFAAALYPRVVKALRVGRDDVLDGVGRFKAAAFLLDTYRAAVPGGTGTTFDWSIARDAVATGRRVILSGGLGPDNVAAAIAAVRPYAVDVASGVETSPGRKDHEKLRAFITAAKAVTPASELASEDESSVRRGGSRFFATSAEGFRLRGRTC